MDRRMECYQTVICDSLVISLIFTIKVITIQKDHLMQLILFRHIIYNHEKKERGALEFDLITL